MRYRPLVVLVALHAMAASGERPIRAENPTYDAQLFPQRLNLGVLRVGARCEAGAYVILDPPQEEGLSIQVHAPRFLKTKSLRIREQTRLDKPVHLIEVGLSLDTSQEANHKGSIRILYGKAKIEIPVEAEIRPFDPDLTRVLLICHKFGSASSDSECYRPWFELVQAARLDVSYFDPSREGLGREGLGLGDVKRDKNDMPVVPDWLKRYDSILLLDNGCFYVQGNDVGMLQSYVHGGGRLIVNASSFMLGSVPNANRIIETFGLSMRDEVTSGPLGKRGPWLVDEKCINTDIMTSGIKQIAFTGVSPVSILDRRRGKVLVNCPFYRNQGFVAVSRDKGEVITMGMPSLFGWIGQAKGEADNAAFLSNLLQRIVP